MLTFVRLFDCRLYDRMTVFPIKLISVQLRSLEFRPSSELQFSSLQSFQFTSVLFSQPASLPVNQSVGESVSPVSQCVTQPVSQSVAQSASQSVSQSV